MKRKSRPAAPKTHIFQTEKVSDLVVDVFYAHENFSSARVRDFLSAFGAVTHLAHGIARIDLDLLPGQDAEACMDYLAEQTVFDAQANNLYWRSGHKG